MVFQALEKVLELFEVDTATLVLVKGVKELLQVTLFIVEVKFEKQLLDFFHVKVAVGVLVHLGP